MFPYLLDQYFLGAGFRVLKLHVAIKTAEN